MLMEDPRVAEAGVIGVPDPMMGERIKAFVSPSRGVDDGPKALRRELTAHARRRLGAQRRHA